MAFRKIRSLINLPGDKDKGGKPSSPVEAAVDQQQDETSPHRYTYKESDKEFPNDPHADAEIIAGIKEEYFTDESFDSSYDELLSLGDSLDIDQINKNRDTLRHQLQAVSKRFSDLVLENHSSYVQELQRVMELQSNLQTANIICLNGRRQLASAKDGFTASSLSIIANHRKKLHLINLLRTLGMIKTLQRTDVRLREILEEEDYPGAIQLCLECQKAVTTFRHFSCISELSSKLQDTLEQIEEQLDQALAKTCNSFDRDHYSKVQSAYRLLGKTQTSMDQLHMHYTSAINNTAFNIVCGFVELSAGTSDGKFQKMPYKDICGYIQMDMFIPCLTDLCKALWNVMNSYYKTMEWHDKFDPANEEESENQKDEANINVETNFDRKYIRKKLEHGLSRIWQDVQQKVKTYLLGSDLSSFKFDDFIFVLDLVKRMMEVGEDFCGSKSESLQESIRQQSLSYFKSYHKSRLEELKMFLENEAWELCPVKSTFSLLNLQEFKFMKKARSSSNSGVTIRDANAAANISTVSENVFVKFSDLGNPFDLQIDEEEGEDVMASNGIERDEGTFEDHYESSDSDVPDELKQDFVDEKTGETPTKRSSLKRKGKIEKPYTTFSTPILTNTTLTVLRFFGKYMQMINVLKPIAFDVVLCMSQLFDSYLYAIYTFFASESGGTNLSSKLATSLQRIHHSLMVTDPLQGVPIGDSARKPLFSLLPTVRLNQAFNLFGLAERVVATESLVFLAGQFEFLQPSLESIIPQSKKPFLKQFYSQTVNVASELRKPVYQTVANQSVNFDHVFQLMSNVKWDIREIMSQHSDYVDVVLRELEIFDGKLLEISKRVPLPITVYNIIWENVIKMVHWTFVEGFASAKKCSNEGRALMQLDFQQFLLKLDKITDLRPIPDKEFVETYIKAFYLTDADMELWIKDHREYSTKQLMGLVGSLGKKSRQKLLTVIEEVDKVRK